jgi:gas vesicle protein
MRSFIRFMEGFLLGALIGVVVAILLTPFSGDELRLRMREEADRIQGEVKRAASERRAELEEQLAALRSPQKG